MEPNSTFVTFTLSKERSRDFKRALSIATAAHIRTVTVDGIPMVEFEFSMADNTEEVFRFKITDGLHDFAAFLFMLDLRNLRTFMRLVKPGDSITVDVWRDDGPNSLREVGFTLQKLVFKTKGIETEVVLLGRPSSHPANPVKIFERRIGDDYGSVETDKVIY